MRALVLLLAACQAAAVPIADVAPVRDRVVLTGSIAPTAATELAVPATDESTLVVRWLAEDGAIVKAGDRVAELDATPFLTRLREEQTRLDSAEAQARVVQRAATIELGNKRFAVRQREIARDKARLRAEVPADLVTKRAAHDSQMQLVRTETDLRAAQKELETTTAAHAIAARIREIELEKTRAWIRIVTDVLPKLELKAPRDGIIKVGTNPSENRTFRVDDSVEQGVVIVTQPDLARPMEVHADLSDVDDGRVAVGDLGTCTLDAYPHDPLACSVTAVSPIARAPTRDSLRRTFTVKLSLTASDPAQLRPGLSVKVELGTANPADVVRDDVRTVDVVGELGASEIADVKAPRFRESRYFTISWLAAEGSHVEAGAEVARFDESELARDVESSTSDIAESKQRVDRKRAEMVLARRAEALQIIEAESAAKRAALKTEIPKELVAAIDMRSQQLDGESARISLEQAKREAAQASSADAADLRDLVETGEVAKRQLVERQENRTRLSVVAPSAGTLVYLRKVGDGIYHGGTLAQVVGLDNMIGLGQIDEIDLGRLRVGAPVTLRIDTLPDVQLRGTLTAITSDVQARETDPSKVVRVKLSLAPGNAPLRPGMRFHGSIEVQP